ncbi:alkene reductase [Leptothermofonsia sichuanensis E412]|uniref:alkene reductase n=1 Tax=Leptothermofonsia sichuanensis TaxID=2917832 RepID=UPI001CA789EE|nr:alkene reductase [Leptothermofonsia sichuanensis]QZZ22035.1 alkene reductase [Leptothermofonsia sichuanensis E412]
MSAEKTMLSPVRLGAYELPNRIVMAPLTRNRAGAGNVPGPLNATYYEQRASAGLIVTEATQISPQGVGYPSTPGIHSPEQVEGWRLVTDAVHARGGHIFLQLWHVGRISHPSLQPEGALPVAPSAIAPEGMASTYSGPQPFVTPRALAIEEIPGIIEDYRKAAENALKAGFDGVEIHSANGYLLDQFLQDGTNHRTDEYGGSMENRARLLMQVTAAVTSVWGGDRVGIRLSPSGVFNSMSDSNPKALFTYVVNELNRFNLAYLHLVEPRTNETASPEQQELTCGYFRSVYRGTLISAGGHDRESGNQAIASGDADLIAFGRLYISNPDLVERFAQNAPLNPYDRSTFYGGDEKGYIDYPFLKLQTA